MKWKNIFKGFAAMLTLCAAMTSLQVQADEVERYIQGYYVYGEGQEGDTPGRYYIVGYKGTGINKLTIPEEIKGKTIEFIDGQAFLGCRDIKTVSLPETIEGIYRKSFKDCSGLRSITIPNAQFIDEEVFANCVSLESITLPDDLLMLGDRVFWNCEKLESITLPANIETLGEQVFLGCGSLKEILVSEENTNFQAADGILYDHEMTKMLFCPQGKTGSITIPATVTDVSEVLGGDFVNDKIEPLFGITDIYVEEGNPSFSSIDGVLYNKEQTRLIYCPPGKEGKITIPATVTEIGNYTEYPNSNGSYWLRSAFYGCKKLTEIEVAKENTVYTSQDGVLYSKDLKTMHYLPEAKTGTLTIPAALWYMEEAFESLEAGFDQCGNNQLTEILVEEGNAFFEVKDGILYGNDMKNLYLCPRYKTGNIVIPDTVKTIEAEAFENCTDITAITLTGTTPWIEPGAFKGCTGLTEITLPTGVTEIRSSTFEGCSNLTTIVAEGVKRLYGYAFKDCKRLRNLTFSEEFCSLYDGVFLNCTSLKSFPMNENLKTIGKEAFAGCTALSEVCIPGSVEDISERAFKDCTALAEVTLAEGVEEIRTGAFANCTRIRRITVPTTVRYMMPAFCGCRGLDEVTIKSTDCIMYYLGSVFHECDMDLQLRVIEGSTAENFAKSWGYDYRYIIDPSTLPMKDTIDLSEGSVVVYEENYFEQNGTAYAYTDTLKVTGGTAEEPIDQTLYSRADSLKLVIDNLHICAYKDPICAEKDLEIEVRNINTITASFCSHNVFYGGGVISANNMRLIGDGILNIQAGTMENADQSMDTVCLKGDLEINGSDDLEVKAVTANKKAYECMTVRGNFKLLNGNVLVEGSREGVYVVGDAIISGGTFTAAAWGQGINALEKAVISDGIVDIEIDEIPEGYMAMPACIMANGNVEISGGDVRLHSAAESVSGIHVDENESTLLVTGGKLESVMTGDGAYGLYSNGKIEVAGGRVDVDSPAGFVGGYRGFSISDGTVRVNANVVIVHNGSDIYISGGDIQIESSEVMHIVSDIYVMPKKEKCLDVIYGPDKENSQRKIYTQESGGKLYCNTEALQYLEVKEKEAYSFDGIEGMESVIYDGKAKVGYTGSFAAVDGLDINTLTCIYEGRNTTAYEKSTIPPINVGDYKVTISLPMDNEKYYGEKVIEYSIEKRPLRVAPMNMTILCGEALPKEYTLEYIGIVDGEPLPTADKAPKFILINENGDIEADIDTNAAGKYTIEWDQNVQVNFSGVDNYEVTKGLGILTISKKAQEPELPENPDTPQAPTKPENPDMPQTPAKPENPEDETKSDITSGLGVSEETAEKIEDLKDELDISMDVLLTTDATIKSQSSEDVKGAEFKTLCANAYKRTKNSISLKWKKAKKADGYILYGNRCNSKGKKYTYEYIKTFSANKTSYTHKKLKKGTYYKFVILAYKLVDGKKVTIASSKTIHAVTTGGKYGVAKTLKLNKAKLTLKTGEKFKLKATEVKQDKTIRRHRKVKFETDNSNIAVVSKKGIVKAKSKGMCYIYVYAQNGVYKKVRVIVK
ncbi:MAG: leucine-rich repeat protein [Lachnospiraceae bacterium]|nr:leucine-rich repeat protein [Lachnospiraceae bacterium]